MSTPHFRADEVGCLLAAHDEAPAYRLLRVARPVPGATAALIAGYTRAGQYLRIRAEGHEGYYAIASPPDPNAGSLELLVKRGGALSDHLAAASPGVTFEMSSPEGSGFATEGAEGFDLLLLAAGSGIAPIRALARSLVARRAAFGRITLIYGERHPRDFAFRRDLDLLAAHIEVVLVVSGDAAWEGARGYVQGVAEDVEPAHDATRTRVYMCGMREMLQGARDMAVRLGIPADRVQTNF